MLSRSAALRGAGLPAQGFVETAVSLRLSTLDTGVTALAVGELEAEAMEKEIQRRIQLCERAQNAEWHDIVTLAENLDSAQRAFLTEHPPGLIKALWNHFASTRDQCGCQSAAHERPDCTVRLIERLLLDQQCA